MSGAQISHFLKQVGKGSELAGIGKVYCAGWLAGVGQTLTVVGAGYGVYRLGRWGYIKLMEYMKERDVTVVRDDVKTGVWQDTSNWPR